MRTNKTSPPDCFGRVHRGGPCGPDCEQVLAVRLSPYHFKAAQYLKELERLRAAVLRLVEDVEALGQPRPEAEQLFQDTLIRYHEQEREFVAAQRGGDKQVA